MKYIKLFEELASDLPTLRDVLNPDHFDEEEDHLEMYSEAALETCKMLNVSLPPEFAELNDLGLIDQRDLINILPLDSVVEVFNLLDLTHLTEPRVREFCRRFPGILAYDPDTEEYRRPESSRQLEEIYIESPVQIWDDVRVVLFEDKNGLRAVEWEDHSNLGYFMLRRDLESAQPSK